MSRVSRIFIFGFMVWCIIGALFRLLVMTVRDQPYDAIPIITIVLVITGFFILSIDRKAPND